MSVLNQQQKYSIEFELVLSGFCPVNPKAPPLPFRFCQNQKQQLSISQICQFKLRGLPVTTNRTCQSNDAYAWMNGSCSKFIKKCNRFPTYCDEKMESSTGYYCGFAPGKPPITVSADTYKRFNFTYYMRGACPPIPKQYALSFNPSDS